MCGILPEYALQLRIYALMAQTGFGIHRSSHDSLVRVACAQQARFFYESWVPIECLQFNPVAACALTIPKSQGSTFYQIVYDHHKIHNFYKYYQRFPFYHNHVSSVSSIKDKQINNWDWVIIACLQLPWISSDD